MTATQDRGKLTQEVQELRDHMEIKDRKINVLQRKVCIIPLLKFQNIFFFFKYLFLRTYIVNLNLYLLIYLINF